ncbi:MAG TPA: HD domain-containing phosphohydrolase [Solirubrobacteraceae bacterium]|nr:HD domain-containing phosphohydrolase [Solirubrobacteraceae bacterium]
MPATAEDLDHAGLRLAELIGAMSLAVDLGLGQPTEHVLRASVIGLHLAERLGLGEEERAAIYYAELIAWVGCHADSHEQARFFGDDIAFRAGTYEVDLVGLSAARYLMRNLGAGRGPLRRARTAAAFVASGRHWIEVMEPTHCLVSGQLAERLGLGTAVRDPLHEAFERWDGKGAPKGIKGEQLSLAARIVQLVDVIEVFHRAEGIDAAVAVAQQRRGTQFDPALVDLFCADATAILAGLDAATSWDALIDAEPALRPVLKGSDLDAALEAVADFADLKSPYTAGHSQAVAELAACAGEDYGLPAGDVVALRRASLVCGVGRLGVSNAIWDKPGPLTPAETERMRLHPYLAERVLSTAPGLQALGTLAGEQNERLDGSGYPRGLAAAALGPAARVLAAAHVYQALREERPHRDTLGDADAEAELRGEVRAGRLDGEAVNAVLRAAGHRVRRRREWPAGLTPREIDVLRLLVRGHTNAQIAQRLVLAPKTVANHIAHIYLKADVNSRASASLFAMRHGLIDDDEKMS